MPTPEESAAIIKRMKEDAFRHGKIDFRMAADQLGERMRLFSKEQMTDFCESVCGRYGLGNVDYYRSGWCAAQQEWENGHDANV